MSCLIVLVSLLEAGQQPPFVGKGVVDRILGPQCPIEEAGTTTDNKNLETRGCDDCEIKLLERHAFFVSDRVNLQVPFARQILPLIIMPVFAASDKVNFVCGRHDTDLPGVVHVHLVRFVLAVAFQPGEAGLLFRPLLGIAVVSPE